MERKGKETAEAGGTCCELQRRRMALNVRSPTGGECGSASSGEAQNQAHFLGGITEISHWALMGKVTHGSDKKAYVVFEKYNVTYDEISGKVHIPYLETHCLSSSETSTKA